MSLDDVVPFQVVKHCKLTWLFDNVYQCRRLLKTCIDGPDYGARCVSQFPWVLKVGQSTNREQKGISLFIKGVNLSNEILVNFCVYLRKSDSLKPLLDEKYQAVFGGENIWESPLIMTNDDFKMVSQSKLHSDFWDIRVELMWNEKIEPASEVKEDSYDAVWKLLSFKELGTDLKQFFKNGKFSDICIPCKNEEIPCHKAVLGARCPLFAQMINSYGGGDSEGTASDSSPTKDLDVLKTFLMYLYTGDIESLMENGPLPVGIHTCAQRMKKHDLEWLTSPFHLCGYTRILPESIKYEWKVDNLHKRIKQGDDSWVICSKAFSRESKTVFTLRIKSGMSKSLVPCISVFLHLEKLEKGDSIAAICDLSVKHGGKDVISKRAEGDLTLQSFIEFPELLSIDAFSGDSDTLFICEISYSGEDLTADISKMSLNCAIKPNEMASPVAELGDGCHGWINMSWDLGQLLMNANHSDCFIVVGGDRLPAHRVILAARSPYFSTVFDVKEKECEGTSKGMEILVEKDVETNTEMMKIILEEIYTGTSKIKDSESAKNAYNLAKFFGLRRLENKCLKFFEST